MQRQLFYDFLSSCRTPPPPIDPKPKFKKLKDAEVATYTEAQALTSGAVLEAVVQEGEGEDKPKEGDLIYFHFSLHRTNEQESVVYSTRSENGSTNGSPTVAVMGKHPRLPRAWEMSLPEMKKGERRVLRVKPDFGFDHKDCNFHLPLDDIGPEHEELNMDIQLINWYKAEDVVASFGSGPVVLKCVLADGEGYENPRPPYKVETQLTIRTVAVDGVQCGGDAIYSTEHETSVITMGDPDVPSGIQSCLNSMVQNEHAVCIVDAADMASSSTIFPTIPEQYRQIEIELRIIRVIQVRDIYGDGTIVKYRMKDGQGTFPSDCPLQDCRVYVHYKVKKWIPGSTSQASEWTYDTRTINEGLPIAIDLGCGDLPFGLESCIHLMLPKEVSRIECKSQSAYENINTRCPLPKGLSIEDDVEFEVELDRFEQGMQWAGISVRESLKEAGAMKEIANNLYKEGATKLAANKYRTIVQQLSQLRDFESEEDVEESDRLTVSCFGNLASCAIQDGDYVVAIDWCDKALNMDEANGKVLLRRAKAYSLNGDFEESESDLAEVVRLNPELKNEAEEVSIKNKQRKRAANLKQKQQFQNFFDRKS